MNKKDLFNQEHVEFQDIDRYVREEGISNLKAKDLEILFSKCENATFSPVDIYKYISAKEINEKNEHNAEVMERWTKAVGIFTIIATLATVASLIINIINK